MEANVCVYVKTLRRASVLYSFMFMPANNSSQHKSDEYMSDEESEQQIRLRQGNG